MNGAGAITVFTPSWADEDNSNAQNHTVKEVVARLPADKIRVVMICGGKPDPRIAARPNTTLLPYYRHGNTAHLLARVLMSAPDIYFFPRSGPLDRAVLALRKTHLWHTAVVTYIVMAMNQTTASEMIRRSVHEGDVVVGNSVYVADTIRQTFGRQAEVICDGVDRSLFFQANQVNASGDKRLTVLYAGSFQARKRVELVIEQAARLKQVQFRLAGKGETEAGCRELASRLECTNVTFLGHLSSVDLGEEMRNSDVFLFPSILEGHPQVLIQAAGTGLPAIAMDVYHPDYIVNGKTGFLVESDAQLSEKLDLLLGDAALRRQMSAAAAIHARIFDWDQITAQWVEVFQRVAGR